MIGKRVGLEILRGGEFAEMREGIYYLEISKNQSVRLIETGGLSGVFETQGKKMAREAGKEESSSYLECLLHRGEGNDLTRGCSKRRRRLLVRGITRTHPKTGTIPEDE